MVQVIRPSHVHRKELESFFARYPGAKGRTIGQRDANGHKQGASCYYRMGLTGPYLVSREHYEDDRLHGLAEHWYPTGQPKAQFAYEHGRFHGVCKTWYPNGNLEFSISYARDKQDGLAEKWYVDGQKKSSAYYRNGFAHGVHERWYGNGVKENSAHYHHGVLHGIDQEWYPNGRPRSVATYHRGQKHGMQSYWYANGNPLMQTTYKNGKHDGLCVAWDEHGAIEDVLLYAEGKVVKSYNEQLFEIQKQDMLKARCGIKRRDTTILMHDQIAEIVRCNAELHSSASTLGYMQEHKSRLSHMAMKFGV